MRETEVKSCAVTLSRYGGNIYVIGPAYVESGLVIEQHERRIHIDTLNEARNLAETILAVVEETEARWKAIKDESDKKR